MNPKCKHKRKRKMVWPDGGTSELCTDCLQARHIAVFTTKWQNHDYKSIGAWYREAAILQDALDIIA